VTKSVKLIMELKPFNIEGDTASGAGQKPVSIAGMSEDQSSEIGDECSHFSIRTTTSLNSA
jgi:hypothetical protein